jgi:hypothetical protein
LEGAKDNTTMKKTYIEPKNTVVKLSLETMIAGSADPTQGFNNDKEAIIDLGGNAEMESREVIDIPDAWEEW